MTLKSKRLLARQSIRMKRVFPEILSIEEEAYAEYLLEIRVLVRNDPSLKDMAITQNFIKKTMFLENNGNSEYYTDADVQSANELLSYLLDLKELSTRLVFALLF